MSYVYVLPWTSADATNFLKVLASDWQINGIFQAFSGTPFTVTGTSFDLNLDGFGETRPVLLDP